MEIDKNIILCPYCGQVSKIVWVHGHGQCFVCKTIIDECCRGEQDISSEKNINNPPIKNNNNEKQ